MILANANQRLEKNFVMGEFTCPCGCGETIFDYRVVRGLQRLHNYYTRVYGACRIDIKVGTRCHRFNEDLIRRYEAGEYPNKPAKNTWHFRGAVDIHVFIKRTGMDWEKVDTGEVDKVARRIRFTGRGIYNTFNHLDMRPKPAHWDNRSK